MNRTLADTYKFQERNIRLWISQMNTIFDDFEYEKDIPFDADFSTKEIAGAKRQRFEYLAERVYNLCIAYFESKQLPNYIVKFDKKILPFFKNKKTLFSPYSTLTETRSGLTHMFEQFLNSFPAFGSGEKDVTGLDILENTLESTAIILQKMKITPTKETDVSGAVKFFCTVMFPKDVQFPSEPFIQTAKCYIPDILIPSLNCAIEYKYATTDKRLTTTIDEIHADVNGYSNHDIYKLFFAVFYVKSGIIIKKRFEQIWNEKQFPDNWKGILVQGNSE